MELMVEDCGEEIEPMPNSQLNGKFGNLCNSVYGNCHNCRDNYRRMDKQLEDAGKLILARIRDFVLFLPLIVSAITVGLGILIGLLNYFQNY